MSFFSCIGKKSKRRKNSRTEPLDKNVPIKTIQEDDESVASTGKDEIDGLITKTKKTSLPSPTEDETERTIELRSENDRLQTELVKVQAELKKSEDLLRSKVKEIHRLEDLTLEMKSKSIQHEAEMSRLGTENQTFQERIAAMEERQKELSRMELQSMINQLEEVEKKANGKTELSGIRTNPGEVMARKKPSITQEDKQVAFKLSKTELRLSQSEDENKRLREDLKEMLDSHSELQCQMVCEKENANTTSTSTAEYASVIVRERSRTPSPIAASPILEEIVTETHVQKVDELMTRLMKAETDQTQLKEEYGSLEKSYTDLQMRLDAAETKNALLEESKQTESGLEVRLSEQENVHTRLSLEMKALEEVIQNLTSRMDKLSSENTAVKSKNDNLTKQDRNQKNQIDKLSSDIEKLKEENTCIIEENKRSLQQLQQRIEMQSNSKVETLQNELTQLKEKHEEVLQRLSRVSSEVLLKKNSMIRPLDDVRSSPAKLAEEFRCEVYDQDWLAAYTSLSANMRNDEKRSIQILMEICTEAYLFCKRASRYQLDTIASVLVSPAGNHYRSGQFNKRNSAMKVSLEKIPEDIRRQLSNFRLNPSKEHVDSFSREFLGQIDYDRTRYLRHISERDLNEIMTYIRHCVDVCWRMVVQDPPMYLLFKLKHGHDIEESKFDKYTVNGKRVDFVVWPAVLLQEGGERLEKGVVQPLPERG